MASRRGAEQCWVVVEAGATSPAFAEDMSGDCLLVEQAPEERALAFASRVQRELALAAPAVVLAFLVCASEGDRDVTAARERIACSLSDALLGRGAGELLLMAHASSTDDTRDHLFSLAGALCERAAGTAVGVRVRFAELGSGVMPSARLLEADEPGYSRYG
jgi:hypothetical protein